jgi:hypothetical protein
MYLPDCPSRNFYKTNENTGYFLRHEFLPHSWNNGIVERWNIGFLKDIIHFKLYRQDEFCHLPNIAVSQDPFFQYSTIPIGANPLTCIVTKDDVKKIRRRVYWSIGIQRRMGRAFKEDGFILY